jgi:hypothetical protein
MANRYYRPSAPRYTSQFVEKQYPTDLMLAGIQMKYQQLENFAKSTGELQGEIAVMPNGPRTQDMAPKIREYWTNKVMQWTNGNLNNYDSPQAMSQLTQMKMEFMKDPNVRMMKQDFEDSEMYNTMRMKSEAADIDPNFDYKQGRLTQLKPGEPYKQYANFVKFQDVPERFYGEVENIKPQLTHTAYLTTDVDPITGQKRERQTEGNVEIRNKAMMEPVIESFIKRYKEGTDDWAVYMRKSDEINRGGLRNEEELKEYFNMLAEDKQIFRPQLSSRWPAVAESGSGTSETPGISSGIVAPFGISERYKGDQKLSKKQIGKKSIPQFFNNLFNKPDVDLRETAESENVYNYLSNNNPEFKNADKGRQIKMMKEYIKTESERPYSPSAIPFTTDEQKEISQVYGGVQIANGKVQLSSPGSLLEGASLFDLKTGTEIQDVDNLKKSLTKEGNYFNIIGRINPTDIPKMPHPNMIAGEYQSGRNSGRVALQVHYQDPLIDHQQRIPWNFGSPERDPVSGIGEIFAMKFFDESSGLPIKVYDLENTRDAGDDPKNLNISEALYFLPFIDNSDNKYKVNVYERNPYLDSNIKEGTDKNIISNKNKNLVYQYVGDNDYNYEKAYNEILGRIFSQE